MGYTIWPDGPTGDVLQAVNAERQRQEELLRAGKFPWTCAATTPTWEAKLAVLVEEVGEVGREVVETIIHGARDEVERRRLREELIQVAAVAVAWAESLQ